VKQGPTGIWVVTSWTLALLRVLRALPVRSATSRWKPVLPGSPTAPGCVGKYSSCRDDVALGFNQEKDV